MSSCFPGDDGIGIMLKFVCDRQGTVRKAILYIDRSRLIIDK